MAAESSVYCDVWELARRQGEVHADLPLQQARRVADELVDDDGVLRYRFAGYVDARGRPAAMLELDGAVRVRCDRCGEPVEIRIQERADFFFVADESELARLPIDETPEEPLLGSRRFDLTALVEDQAILALPLSPRHEHCTLPDVAGEDDSATGEDERQRPFATLEALKRRRQ
jgi:uncharacterized protein